MSFKLHAVGAAALLLATGIANAAITFDANVTPGPNPSGLIFGSGNDNGSFTVDTANNVELGLRGKLRHDATGQPQNIFNSNGDGTYSFATGVAPTQSAPTGVWSFEWAINTNLSGTGTTMLGGLTYVLGIDSDASQGTSYTTFDPINGVNPHPAVGVVCWDHSTGNNATTRFTDTTANCGAGNVNRVADYAAQLAADNVAQQSWKASWFIPGYDPTVDGTYNFYLAAFDATGAQMARTDIQIIAGAGGAPVIPEPGSLALVGLALVGLAAARRRA